MDPAPNREPPRGGDANPPARVRAEPERGLVLIVDAKGRERPYLVTRAEALMVQTLAEVRPAWLSAAEMRGREPRIYNPAVILARLRGKGLSGFRIETDDRRRMRLVID